MDHTVQQLLGHIRTREDHDAIREDLVVLKNQVYRSVTTGQHAMPDRLLSSRTGEHLRLAMALYARQHQGDTAPFFEELEKALSQLVLLHIEIAFEPTDDVIAQLSDWARSHADEHIMLGITVNKIIGGGARLAFKGRYKEVILQQLVADVLKQERAAISKEMSLD